MNFEQNDNIKAAVLLRHLISFYKYIDFSQYNVKAAWLKPKKITLAIPLFYYYLPVF